MAKSASLKGKMAKDRKKSVAQKAAEESGPPSKEDVSLEEASNTEDAPEEVTEEIPEEEFEEEIIEEEPLPDPLHDLLHLIVSSWSGPCEAAVPNGFGQMIMRSGVIYEGDVEMGRLHGKGKLNLPNGWTYEGDFYESSIQGNGRISFPDGAEYEGQVAAGYRHGKGHYRHGNVSYNGQWKAGKKHGEGRCQWSPNSFYEGGWYEGKCHGLGTRQWDSLDCYSGEWSNGERHGRGKIIWGESDQEYTGDWVHGIQHGEGTATWKGIKTAEYSGSWSNGKRHGAGVMTYGDGSYYSGQWQNDKKWGEAEIVSTTGYKRFPVFFEDDRMLDQSEVHNKFYSITETQLEATLGDYLSEGKAGILRNIGLIRQLYSNYSERGTLRLMHFDRLCVEYGIVKKHPIEGFYSETIKDPMRPLLLREFCWYIVNTARVVFHGHTIDDAVQLLIDGHLSKQPLTKDLYRQEIIAMRDGLCQMWAANNFSMTGRQFLQFLKHIGGPFTSTQGVDMLSRDDPSISDDIDRPISFIQFANALIGMIIESRNPLEAEVSQHDPTTQEMNPTPSSGDELSADQNLTQTESEVQSMTVTSKSKGTLSSESQKTKPSVTLKSGSLLQTISDLSDRVKSGGSRSMISTSSVMTEVLDFFKDHILTPWNEYEMVCAMMDKLEVAKATNVVGPVAELVSSRYLQSLSLTSVASAVTTTTTES